MAVQLAVVFTISVGVPEYCSMLVVFHCMAMLISRTDGAVHRAGCDMLGAWVKADGEDFSRVP